MAELRNAPLPCRKAIRELSRRHGGRAVARRVEEGYSVVVARRSRFFRYHVAFTGATSLVESWPRTFKQIVYDKLHLLGMALTAGSVIAFVLFYGGSAYLVKDFDVNWGPTLLALGFVAGIVIAVWLYGRGVMRATSEHVPGEDAEWFWVGSADGNGDGDGGNGGNGGD